MHPLFLENYIHCRSHLGCSNNAFVGEEREETKIKFSLSDVVECVQYLPHADVTNADSGGVAADTKASYTTYEVEAKLDEPSCFMLPVGKEASLSGSIDATVTSGIEHSSELRLYYKSEDVSQPIFHVSLLNLFVHLVNQLCAYFREIIHKV